MQFVDVQYLAFAAAAAADVDAITIGAVSAAAVAAAASQVERRPSLGAERDKTPLGPPSLPPEALRQDELLQR